ncbi:MAG: hypothetical protein ACX93T_03930 [Bacteroidota bacterium]
MPIYLSTAPQGISGTQMHLFCRGLAPAADVETPIVPVNLFAAFQGVASTQEDAVRAYVAEPSLAGVETPIMPVNLFAAFQGVASTQEDAVRAYVAGPSLAGVETPIMPVNLFAAFQGVASTQENAAPASASIATSMTPVVLFATPQEVASTQENAAPASASTATSMTPMELFATPQEVASTRENAVPSLASTATSMTPVVLFAAPQRVASTQENVPLSSASAATSMTPVELPTTFEAANSFFSPASDTELDFPSLSVVRPPLEDLFVASSKAKKSAKKDLLPPRKTVAKPTLPAAWSPALSEASSTPQNPFLGCWGYLRRWLPIDTNTSRPPVVNNEYPGRPPHHDDEL